MQTKLAEILEHLSDAQAIIDLASSWCRASTRDEGGLARDLAGASDNIDEAIKKLERHSKEEGE